MATLLRTRQIADGNVTLAKIANASANSKLLGSGASGSGIPYTEITLGTNLSMSGTTLNATGGGGGGTPGGSDTQVQFNDGGLFGGDAGFTYDKTTDSLTLAGNQTFSGSAKRIKGDLSNATRSTRLSFQTSTTDSNTLVQAIPSGTGTLSGFLAYGESDPDNSSYLQVHAEDSVHVGLNSGKSGTGATQDLVFQIDGTTKAKVNAADGKFNVDTLTASSPFIGTDSSKNLASVTATAATASLNAMVGDSGSGGTKGLVPAPSTGDAAANKFLKADGTWSSSGTLILNETPSGTINGSNATFTLASSPTSPVELTQFDSTGGSGITLLQGTAYNISGSTITFVSGFEPQTGTTLRAKYGTSAVASGVTLLGDVTGSGTSTITTTLSDSARVPVGAIQQFVTAGGDSYLTSANWLKIDNSTVSVVSQSTYPTLFARTGLLKTCGLSWTRSKVSTALPTQNIQAIASSGTGSLYVAISTTSNAYSSTDCVSWTLRTSGTASVVNSCDFGAGVFVFCTNGGGISSSTDGVTWTTRTSGTASNLVSVKFLNNNFVAVGAGGVVCYSTDGTSWTQTVTGIGSNLSVVTYGNGIYVAAGQSGAIAKSTNLTSWTNVNVASEFTINPVSSASYFGSNYVLVGDGNFMMTSTDATNWSPLTIPSVVGYSGFRGSIVSNGIFYLGVAANSGSIYTTTDLAKWNCVASVYIGTILAFCQDSARLVATGSNSQVFYSSNAEYSYNTATSFALPNISSNFGFGVNNTNAPSPSYYIKAL